MPKALLKDPMLREIKKQFDTFYKYGWEMYNCHSKNQVHAEIALAIEIKSIIGRYETLRKVKA